MRCSSSKEENQRFMQRQQLSISKLQAMFFNSLGGLSESSNAMAKWNWLPKSKAVREILDDHQNTHFLIDHLWYRHSPHQHNTGGGVMDWHSRPASLPSPGGPGIRRLRTFGGWGGSANWSWLLFFSIFNLRDWRNHKFFFMPRVTTKIFKTSF